MKTTSGSNKLGHPAGSGSLDQVQTHYEALKWVFTPVIRLDTDAENGVDIFGSRELMVYLLNSIQDGVCVLDKDLSIRYVNSTMRQWYASPGDITGEKCYRIYHNRSEPCDTCPILDAIQSHSPRNGVVKYSLSGDDKGWQELYAIPIFDLHENVLGVVEYVRDITFQYKIGQELNDLVQRFESLENKNEAISQLLYQRKREREELEDTIVQNLQNFIRPSLDYLKMKSNTQDVELIEGLIDEIVYPITRKRPSSFDQMTSRELQVCILIKEGKTSKEIAETLCISKKTIDFHRANIREKLGIGKEPGNRTGLRAYLLSHL